MNAILLTLLTALTAVHCDFNVTNYLKRYGYYNPSEGYSSIQSIDLSISIKTYQKAFRLPQTGVVDEATKQLMQKPRCGVPDDRRHAYFDQRWRKKDLTYYFYNYTPDLPQSDVRQLTERALEVWSNVTQLTFTERSLGDIVLSFGSLQHQDGRGRECEGESFDGIGGVLAHAFLPPDGRLHFDEDETFTNGASRGINYLWVAVHELGHILGLLHDTKNKDSVMYPTYRPAHPDFKLHNNDIRRIQALYGKATGDVATNPPTNQPPITQPPSACQDKFKNCRKYFRRCDNYSSDWTKFMKENCAKTCNKCGGEDCADHVHFNCRRHKWICRGYGRTWTNYMRKHCKKTCSYC